MTSGKNMCIDHTIRCDHTISKKWTFHHTEISFHHTINIWSHRKNFDHTINFQHHTVIILITPSKFWSHRKIFDHTINSQIHAVIILITPSRCWSHSWKIRGNMEPLSESNFGLGISEIFEFRSIGNRGISSRNLGVSVRHLESWNIFGTFLAILEFRSIRCF